MIIRPEAPRDRIALAEYIAHKGGMTAEDLVGSLPFEVLGVVRQGRLLGAVLYNQWRGPSIETHWAGESGWMSRGDLKGIFSYPFLQLECRRITGIVRRNNKTARRIAEKLGFRLEGVCRQGFDDGTAAMIYGMIRSDCKWI